MLIVIDLCIGHPHNHLVHCFGSWPIQITIPHLWSSHRWTSMCTVKRTPSVPCSSMETPSTVAALLLFQGSHSFSFSRLIGARDTLNEPFFSLSSTHSRTFLHSLCCPLLCPGHTHGSVFILLSDPVRSHGSFFSLSLECLGHTQRATSSLLPAHTHGALVACFIAHTGTLSRRSSSCQLFAVCSPVGRRTVVFLLLLDPRCNRILLLVWHSSQPCPSSLVIFLSILVAAGSIVNTFGSSSTRPSSQPDWSSHVPFIGMQPIPSLSPSAELALKTSNRLRSRFDQQPTLRSFFANQSIYELCSTTHVDPSLARTRSVMDCLSPATMVIRFRGKFLTNVG